MSEPRGRMTTATGSAAVPAAAVEAAASVLTGPSTWRDAKAAAAQAIAAAMPHIREQIAHEIDVARYFGDAAIDAECPTDWPTDAFYAGMRAASRVARSAS